jgi:hypothetical protein
MDLFPRIDGRRDRASNLHSSCGKAVITCRDHALTHATGSILARYPQLIIFSVAFVQQRPKALPISRGIAPQHFCHEQSFMPAARS